MLSINNDGTLNLGFTEKDAEYEDLKYRGNELPARFVTPGVLDRAFLTTTENGDPMLKVLYKSTHPEYDGFPVWENITLTPAANFVWVPFSELLGLSPKEFSKIKVDRTDEKASGYPVLSIGNVNLVTTSPVVYFMVKWQTNKETKNRWPEILDISRSEDDF